MKKALCVNKHYFDADRFNICPICGEADFRVLNIESAGASDPEQPQPPKKLPDTDTGFSGSVEKDVPPQPLKDVEDRGRANESNDNPDDPTPLETAIEKTKSTTRKELPVTVRKWDLDNTALPVGWLIGVAGPHFGEFFACSSGRNRIGRADNLEIVLAKDSEITRETHAVLTYEPNKRRFYIQDGASRGIVYLNEDPVLSPSEIQAYDRLKLGGSEFVFLPLCGEHFTWDDYMNKG